MANNFGKLGYKDRKVLRKLSREIGSPKRLLKLNTEQIANIVRGFGNSGFFHERVMNELLKRLQYSLSSISDPRDLAGDLKERIPVHILACSNRKYVLINMPTFNTLTESQKMFIGCIQIVQSFSFKAF